MSGVERLAFAAPIVAGVLVLGLGALVSVVAPPPPNRDDIRTVFFIRDPNRA